MMGLIKFLFQPRIFAACIALFSLSSLAMAFTAEYVYDLKPCILCIYQRIPFAITFLLGLIAYKLARQEHYKGAALMILLSGVAFFANSALAFYHTGVEQHWWKSAFEACTFDPTNLREAVKAPPVPCDSIPWQDPIIGFSMANWNVIVCGIAGAVCSMRAYFVRNVQSN